MINYSVYTQIQAYLGLRGNYETILPRKVLPRDENHGSNRTMESWCSFLALNDEKLEEALLSGTELNTRHRKGKR